MIIVTTESLGVPYEILGLVKATISASCNVVQDTSASIKNLLGGELTTYSCLVDSAVHQALERLEGKAEELGADTIIGLRLSLGNVTKGAVEVVAYGTAVVRRRS